MKRYLLPENGSFYKTNLHAHTTISDGKLSPEEVKAWYKAHGYSAVCFTDHEVLIDQRELCDDEFIALHGYEVSIKQDLSHHTAYFMPVYHFNLLAEKQDNLCMPRFFKNNPSMPGNAREWAEKQGQYDPNDTIHTTEYNVAWLSDYLSAARDAGFLISYNHPQWSLQSAKDFVGIECLHAIEVINGGCRFLNDNTSLHYEQMLRAGMNVVPVGGDDNHNTWDHGHAWTTIKAEALTYDALVKAYKNGDCYASEGPEIKELWIEDDKLHIKCSDADRITYISGNRRRSTVLAEEDAVLNEATFPILKEQDNYFRITVTDKKGKNACTNAYFIDTL